MFCNVDLLCSLDVSEVFCWVSGPNLIRNINTWFAGTVVFGRSTAPAAIMTPDSMWHPSCIVAPFPIIALSSIIQLLILQFTPIMTLSPIFISAVDLVWWFALWRMVLSWIIDPFPIVILHVSPLKTVPWYNEENFWVSTFPITVLLGAIHSLWRVLGKIVFDIGTFLKEGTTRN